MTSHRLRDYVLRRPAGDTYRLHQSIEQLAEQHSVLLWRDDGNRLLVRTDADIAADKVLECAAFAPAQVGTYLFNLEAAVGRKVHRNNKQVTLYPPPGKRKERSDWLASVAQKHGFEVIDVTISAQAVKIARPDGNGFHVDATRFIGLLRVTDADRFNAGLVMGMSRIGKPFGRGLMTVERLY